ncbi:hypothetical protein F5148DRAFT_1232025 [Russula earlei]|uniref:Uncharacterized protein n=1 Tax=Russula earlei TaxID=71964 RepID=A0ACC0TZF7_9AGAM|nr:hypothetical protein F5148DRAFT_1232025 [Russula earlei]
MRIILLTLRITHHSRVPPQWPGRSMIHVAGDWHTTATLPDLAPVRGTVEMVSSGDIRWTLDGQGQWSSVGVQLGGPGSAMGVIGMWTGAEHELSDPLGPFWAWKVGAHLMPVTVIRVLVKITSLREVVQLVTSYILLSL